MRLTRRILFAAHLREISCVLVVGFNDELDNPFDYAKNEAKKTIQDSPMIKPAHKAAKLRMSFFEGFNLFRAVFVFGAVVICGHIINARY